MCTAHSHFIIDGNCLCGVFLNGEYDEKRSPFYNLDKLPPKFRPEKEKKDNV
jgi:hypothetical protein